MDLLMKIYTVADGILKYVIIPYNYIIIMSYNK